MNCLFEFDKNFNTTIIGTDEAGRGPAAGGVFASAVLFNNLSDDLIVELSLLNDSKQLTAKKRELLYPIILKNTINATVCVEVDEIEKNNILNCSLKAMKLACEEVINKAKLKEFLVLVDGNRYIKNFSGKQQLVIKGDSKSASIAAASILAKCSRDNYMKQLDKEFPQYKWSKNAGYLTKEHIKAIEIYGTCKYHRESFLKKLKAKQLTLEIK